MYDLRLQQHYDSRLATSKSFRDQHELGKFDEVFPNPKAAVVTFLAGKKGKPMDVATIVANAIPSQANNGAMPLASAMMAVPTYNAMLVKIETENKDLVQAGVNAEL